MAIRFRMIVPLIINKYSLHQGFCDFVLCIYNEFKSKLLETREVISVNTLSTCSISSPLEQVCIVQRSSDNKTTSRVAFEREQSQKASPWFDVKNNNNNSIGTYKYLFISCLTKL